MQSQIQKTIKKSLNIELPWEHRDTGTIIFGLLSPTDILRLILTYKGFIECLQSLSGLWTSICDEHSIEATQKTFLKTNLYAVFKKKFEKSGDSYTSLTSFKILYTQQCLFPSSIKSSALKTLSAFNAAKKSYRTLRKECFYLEQDINRPIDFTKGSDTEQTLSGILQGLGIPLNKQQVRAFLEFIGEEPYFKHYAGTNKRYVAVLWVLFYVIFPFFKDKAVIKQLLINVWSIFTFYEHFYGLHIDKIESVIHQLLNWLPSGGIFSKGNILSFATPHPGYNKFYWVVKGMADNRFNTKTLSFSLLATLPIFLVEPLTVHSCFLIQMCGNAHIDHIQEVTKEVKYGFLLEPDQLKKLESFKMLLDCIVYDSRFLQFIPFKTLLKNKTSALFELIFKAPGSYDLFYDLFSEGKAQINPKGIQLDFNGGLRDIFDMSVEEFRSMLTELFFRKQDQESSEQFLLKKNISFFPSVEQSNGVQQEALVQKTSITGPI